MKSEIKIILDEDASNKAKGNCFEDLVRNLLSLHQYEIRENINFSGMEIDLVANHKHTNEILYVECKAKEKVSSDELSKFAFNVSHKKADKGYFFRTQELESQAGALLREIQERPEYKKLIFFEPNQIVRMLSDGKMIYEPTSDLTKYVISKKILAITYFGDYFIYLINESNALPTRFIAIDAKQNTKKIHEDTIELLRKRIDEISNLIIIHNHTHYSKNEESIKVESVIETISEVQESDNWYDYLPASSNKKHFVGRDLIKKEILSYFRNIHSGKTSKRIFFLNGKSGWGKSSLVLEIKGRCKNKQNRNKFYAIAIDTRSATSDNFVAISLKKLIDKSIGEGFVQIQMDLFSKEITFTSYLDLFTSDSMLSLLDKLKAQNKFLVLIFDQFEDVFRKKDFFKSFYKFLSDVTDKKPNIIVGFSWKSDFYIQSDDPNYHIWQQSKEQAREFTVNEFREKEIDGIIRQLEGSVGEIEQRTKSRIKESSQGLPWLTKKLCIHIYEQISLGFPKEGLIESNLNLDVLFKKDEERVNPSELKALRLIAKRASEGNFFEETEVGETIDSNTIGSLINKRLIIRSGANYNVYWDIFRDYLVTGQIPVIGESYLLRQMANPCLEIFLLFDKSGKEESLQSLLAKHPKAIGEDALYNTLIELRNIGVVKKNNENYSISNGIDISKDGFISYLKIKFQNYTPYLMLKKSNHAKVTKEIIIQVLRTIFKQDFQDSTWNAYANNLISWFLIANLDISQNIVEPQKGKGVVKYKITIDDIENRIPRSSIQEILEVIPLLSEDPFSIKSKFYRDLLLISVVDIDRNLTQSGEELIAMDDKQRETFLRKEVLSLSKMRELQKDVQANPKIKAKNLVSLKPIEFFKGNKESSKELYAYKALSWLR